MATTNDNVKLPKEVAEEYELVNWQGSHRQRFGNKFGIVDLNKLTLKKAKRLVARGFTKLKKKEEATDTTIENDKKSNKNKP